MASQAPAATSLLVELTGDEQRLLRDIRERKAKLVKEIRQLKSEIKHITGGETTKQSQQQQRQAPQPDLLPSAGVRHELDPQQPDLTSRLDARLEPARGDPASYGHSLHLHQELRLELDLDLHLDLDLRLHQELRLGRPAKVDTGVCAGEPDDELRRRLEADFQRELGKELIQRLEALAQPDLTRSAQPEPARRQQQTHPEQQDQSDKLAKHAKQEPTRPEETQPDSGAGECRFELTPDAEPEPAGALDPEQQLAIGCQRFNVQPDDGLAYLVRQRLLVGTGAEVARFLLGAPALSKRTIGQYLGQNRPFQLLVLREFVRQHDFRRLLVVDALRRFLGGFRLPGESQQIQRFLEQFAEHYCAQNPAVFALADHCFLVCYSLIMLNTVLHNPSVKAKLGRRRFFAMNRAVDRRLLATLYENVRREPFRIPADEPPVGAFSRPDRAGWLTKRAGSLGGRWSRRWFVLSERCLYYFRHPADPEPKCELPV